MTRNRRREGRRLRTGREGHQGEGKSDTGQRTRPREWSQARKRVRGRKQGVEANTGERWKDKNFVNGSDRTVMVVMAISRLLFNALGRMPWTPPPHRLSLANALACASCTDGFTGVSRADTCVRELEAVAECLAFMEGSRRVLRGRGRDDCLRCEGLEALAPTLVTRQQSRTEARRRRVWGSVGPDPILG